MTSANPEAGMWNEIDVNGMRLIQSVYPFGVVEETYKLCITMFYHSKTMAQIIKALEDLQDVILAAFKEK